MGRPSVLTSELFLSGDDSGARVQRIGTRRYAFLVGAFGGFGVVGVVGAVVAVAVVAVAIDGDRRSRSLPRFVLLVIVLRQVDDFGEDNHDDA